MILGALGSPPALPKPGRPGPRPWLGEGGGDLKATKNVEIVMGLSYVGFQNDEKTKSILSFHDLSKPPQFLKVLTLWGPNLKCNLVRRISYFSFQSPI